MAQLEAALQNCSSLSQIGQILGNLISSGLFQTLASVRCKVVELCAISPFGDLPYATEIFWKIHRPATNDWNAVLRGIARGEEPLAAFALFVYMLRQGSARDDALSCSFVVQACARANAVPQTRQLHARVIRRGFMADFRLQTTIVDACAKGGDISGAGNLFDEMPHRDVPTWNALIHGLAAGSRPRDAISLFRRMIAAPASPPDVVTFLGALSACGQLGDLAEGESVQRYAQKFSLEANGRVCNALMDMYAKCGSISGAMEIFRKMPPEALSLVSWNTIIMALALHGNGARALQLFEEMSMGSSNISPDGITYLAVLSGCNHAGMVEDGLRIFRTMSEGTVLPNVKHYGCVVDMLGRSGRLEEAYELISAMKAPPDIVLWQTLLGACKTHGNVPLAEVAASTLARMGSHGDGDYVLLSNVYAAAERWCDVGRVRAAMVEQDVRKVPGFSFVKLGGLTHRFINGGIGEHLMWREIQKMVEEVRAKVAELGHVSETKGNILHDVLEEDKEEALWHHSERLAVALGLGVAEEIVVVKNLRICGDCHAVMKLVSKAYGRALVVRDRARFHRFENGMCSCGDYW